MGVSAQSMENPPSSSKHPKLSGEESVAGRGIDRISELPDSLLCDILSYLPTKLAVATSILSKRWRFLWTWVPTLDFGEKNHHHTAACTTTSLAHIVCRVLALRRQWCIKRFRLKWLCACDSFHFDSWIYAAISGGVQELDLYILNELPCGLFCSKTLVILKLSAVTIGHVPFAYFPSLKSLSLKHADYKDEGSVYRLLSGCPVLEELVLKRIQRLGNKIFELPCCIFLIKTLVTLKLKGEMVMNIPARLCLPSLKVLHLEFIEYKDESSVCNLFSGCPVLEELVFKGVDQYGDKKFELPCCIFFSKTLVTLKLTGEIVMNIPSRVCLPSLKVLHLDVIECKDENSIRNLFSGCPVLEDLYLERLDYDNVIEYEIASLTLKTLVVEFRISGDSLEEAHSHSHKLRVNAPALDYLSIADVVSRCFYFENMANLVQAYVLVSPCDIKRGSIELDVLRAVRNVTTLELNYNIMNAFCYLDLFDKFPKFHNVTTLYLTRFAVSWGVLRHILHKFPQLKDLTLDKESVLEEPEGAWSTQPTDVPNCLALHLTTFCIHEFKGLKDEMEYVRYILKNSMVLKKMTTIFSPGSETKRVLAVMRKIAKFERGSENCKLEHDH